MSIIVRVAEKSLNCVKGQMAKSEKTPIRPRELAVFLLERAVNALESAEKNHEYLEANKNSPDLVGRLSPHQKLELLIELLCALLWLALRILEEDDFVKHMGNLLDAAGLERSYFRDYANQTCKELENLLSDYPEERLVALLREIGEETLLLYIWNEPTLRELAASKGVTSWFEDIIEMEEREPNWLGTFIFKARIRIAAKLPIAPRSVYYLSCSYFVVAALQAAAESFIETFKQLYPAVDLPEAGK